MSGTTSTVLPEKNFDGDAVPGTLSIDRTSPAPKFDSWWVVTDSGKELLREPRRSIDNSLKTHAAIIDDRGATRLIIYDHIFDHNPPRSLVFVSDGKTLVREAPLEDDNDVLAAMGSADETGTYERWVLFQLLAVPALVCYYALFAFVAWKIFRKRP
jgi:hypothetical protein